MKQSTVGPVLAESLKSWTHMADIRVIAIYDITIDSDRWSCRMHNVLTPSNSCLCLEGLHVTDWLEFAMSVRVRACSWYKFFSCENLVLHLPRLIIALLNFLFDSM